METKTTKKPKRNGQVLIHLVTVFLNSYAKTQQQDRPTFEQIEMFGL